jgi:hypothetical protein
MSAVFAVESARYPNLNSFYSRTLLNRIKWEGQPSGYAGNPDNWFFFQNRLQWQFEFRLLVFTVCTRWR